MRAPSGASPKGISDCSIELGKMTSKPITLAPPSVMPVSTRPISRVQVCVGDPLKGEVS
jgi:hypothetical protein